MDERKVHRFGDHLSQEGASAPGATDNVHGVVSDPGGELPNVGCHERGTQKKCVKLQPQCPVVPGLESEMTLASPDQLSQVGVLECHKAQNLMARACRRRPGEAAP